MLYCYITHTSVYKQTVYILYFFVSQNKHLSFEVLLQLKAFKFVDYEKTGHFSHDILLWYFLIHVLFLLSCVHHKLNSINLKIKAVCSVSVWLHLVLHHTKIHINIGGSIKKNLFRSCFSTRKSRVPKTFKHIVTPKSKLSLMYKVQINVPERDTKMLHLPGGFN